MTHTVFFHVTESYIKKEKAKARLLRKTAWWKRKCSRGICHYCNSSITPSQITMDHIIPLSKGGASVKSNIVTACKPCNTQKQHNLPYQWTSYMESLKNTELE
ncbi:MAG: HNH endonuclease [Nitrospirae bacterium]|nr:HNH endonuclease [Nitrospirota bacterium]